MENWTKAEREYIQDTADEYGVEISTAYELANLLGRSELHDGFVIAMEDASEELY